MLIHRMVFLAMIGLSSIGNNGLIASESRRQSPWLEDSLFKAIAVQLDSVLAIDNHTHLMSKGEFKPSSLQSPDGWMWAPIYERALTEAFGVPVRPGGLAEAAKAAEAERARLIQELGVHGYWLKHLNRTRTAIALINDRRSEVTDGGRLRWVPIGSDLLYPVPADSSVAWNPEMDKGIKELRSATLPGLLKDADYKALPRSLTEYIGFVDRTLARWKQRGAVAVKFWDAYDRTLVFSDVPEEQAGILYAKAFDSPLSRPDYIALQDYLVRHMLLECGRLKLPAHFHAGRPEPSFGRSRDSDVRNLDEVITDVRFFGTQFVLIHAGMPQVEEAAYLGSKSHVWVDVSALPFIYPVPENAAFLRILLIACPDKVLFGTDALSGSWVPVGPEVMHVALCRQEREALYLALAGLVRDGLLDIDHAVKMGEMVLHRNAEKLYGFSEQTMNVGK